MKKLTLLLLLVPSALWADEHGIVLPAGWAADPPVLGSLVVFADGQSNLRVALTRYVEDQAAVERRYPLLYSPVRIARLDEFYEGWAGQVEALDFDSLNHEGQLDYILLRNKVRYDQEMLALQRERGAQIAPLIPFADTLRAFQEERFDRIRVQPRAAAESLDAVAAQIDALIDLINDQEKRRKFLKDNKISPVMGWRAANQLAHLREVLADWNTFYNGYDPLFNFWVPEPYGRVDSKLQAYADSIAENVVGIREGDQAPIIGDPVLEAGLRADLTVEMIPYTAEEIIRIGEREFEWIEDRFREVSNDMGYGDDWLAALEHTKQLAPPPGEKPWRIFDIGDYSETFIEDMDNITMPPLAREVWRLKMQTPERQLVNPFFSGGETTHVSYPTAGMAHADKMMSMRGNTPHFNFATVHHELVPGHHMQGFMTDRFNAHRGELSRTPFWGEGWALYWELQLWDADFPRNDPDKIGMLFWRLHRAARIVFSMNYHLGRWTPQECVDFLVERVGHERANAEAEVRRTTIDAPLYQIAYMIGGLQFRALYKELVESGRMTARDFHDTIMQGGRMPVELVRARLTDQAVGPDYRSNWRFYGDP